MFELFEHRADVGVRGFGKSKEEAFAECAKAMFSIMFDFGKAEAREKDLLEAEAADLEGLLVAFLNQLLYLRDVKGKLYSRFEVYITSEGAGFKLGGSAFGEKINSRKHAIKGDVKAASYHQLKVALENGKWVAQCVVDV